MHKGYLILKRLQHNYTHLAHEETPLGCVQTSSWSQGGRKTCSGR